MASRRAAYRTAIASGLSRLLLWSLAACPAPAWAATAFQESAGQVVMQAESYDAKTPRGGGDWVRLTTQSGASNGAYMAALPDAGAIYSANFTTAASELVYNVLFSTTGTYHVWVRGIGPNGNGDSLHAGIDGTGPASADRIQGFNTSWKWSRSTMDTATATIQVATPGLHTIHVWPREDGFLFDKILLRTSSSSTAPSGTGPAESPRVTVGPPPDTQPPTGSVTINGGAATTNALAVILQLAASDDSGTVAQMRIWNEGDAASAPEPYATTKAWTLSAGDGTKRVLAEFADAAGNWSAQASDDIGLDATGPQIQITSPQDGAVITPP
jgi:hypothetical protein